jgi:hypothetical protein
LARRASRLPYRLKRAMARSGPKSGASRWDGARCYCSIPMWKETRRKIAS